MAAPKSTPVPSCRACGAALASAVDLPGSGVCLPCLLAAGLDPEGGTGEITWAEGDPRLPLFPTAAGGDANTARSPWRFFHHYEVCLRADGVTLDELGHGAMGVTYRARDVNLDTPVALKVIGPALSAHPGARERFRREARAAAQLRHPNVASVFHFGQTEAGQCFYAMEFIAGETLEERVCRDGPLSADLALEAGLQVARALVAAEAQGLVHRDLKPSNLMLVAEVGAPNPPDAPLLVKIIDFGLSKAVAAARAVPGGDLTHGGFVGTPAFASPEQFRGGEVPLDTRADIYSLGATLWYLLCGESPFAGRTLEEIRERQTTRPLPLRQLEDARVPAPLVALLRSMLARDPGERPQNARELAERMHRCREQVAAATSHRRARRLAVGGLALVGVMAGIVLALSFTERLPWRQRGDGRGTAGAAWPDKSVAVLPFENRNPDQENDFFADGVQDEVLTDLSKVADLKVISRASVREYKGKSRDLREIGRQLGVEQVVEGSVQRLGNRVRVIAQLSDTRTGTQLWAEKYDREVADVFAIQSEIAEAIAGQLQAKISPREKAAMAEPPTRDLVANALYQQAKELEINYTSDSNSTQQLLRATGLLEEAVARDPQFVLAHCLLCRVHLHLYFGGSDHTPARLERANAALQQAARLRPDAGEVHFETAAYFYNGFRDYDRARAELDLAQRTLPNSAAIYSLLAALDRRQARWTEATRNHDRAAQLDPRNINILENAAFTYQGLRRYAEASRLCERAIAASPRSYFGSRTLRAFQPVWAQADVRPLRQELTAILQEDPGASGRVAEALFRCALFERDPALTQRALALIPPEGLSTNNNFTYPREWFVGLAARAFNDPETARAAFTAVRGSMEKLVKDQPDYALAWSLLGLADAALGRREEAVREGRRACELLPVTRDAWASPLGVIYLALIHTWTGERDLALEQLALSAQTPNGARYGGLKLDPAWDPLRGEPRFEAIVASLAPPSSPPFTVSPASPAAVPAAAPENSIAVLPFQPLVPETRDQALELGMADTLISKLSNSQSVVRSLASVRRYDVLTQNPLEAGRELAVRTVLEGSVQRSADRIRVTARLINVADGVAVWTGSFNERFTDVFAVQDEIAQKVVNALALRLSGAERERLTRRYTDNVEAYQLYLLGRYHFSKLTPGEIKTSIELFQRVLAVDPNYALADYGLAEAYRAMTITGDQRPLDYMPQAKAAAMRALEIDESLAEPHATLAFIHFWFDWDWAGAEREAKRAIELNPNSAFAHFAYAHLLALEGHQEEAIAEGAKAARLDPLSLMVNTLGASFLHFAGREDEADAQLQRALELDANFWIAHHYLGKILVQRGRYAEAGMELARAKEFSRGNSLTIGVAGYAAARAGDVAGARAALEELTARSTQRYVPPSNLALIYAGLGQRDEAFRWLEKGFEEHDIHLSYLRIDPQWDGLRDDPRFASLLQRVGLR